MRQIYIGIVEKLGGADELSSSRVVVCGCVLSERMGGGVGVTANLWSAKLNGTHCRCRVTGGNKRTDDILEPLTYIVTNQQVLGHKMTSMTCNN